ncbi:MAG: CocE/NonD family hydrolase, partial [Gammaproteobacteria bacterium]
YSPVHNVRADSPPQMVVVAEQDFSAPPGQAYKLVAARQAAQAPGTRQAPVLLRVVKGEGHTGWRPASTRRVLAEEIAFLRQALGVSPSLAQPDLVDARVRLRDGVELSTNVWLPQGRGRSATVLLRTPYGNDVAEFERLGLADYVAAGYAVAIQSVRGRGGSGGEFGFFFAEGKDGYDAVEWIAAQPWSNGRVAMDGGSYLGTAQWLAAREQPPHLTCIMPAVAAGDWFNEIPYMGGALQVNWAFSWLGMLAGITFDFDERGDRNLQKYRPLQDAETVLGAKLPWYQEVLAHPTLDAWWQRVSFSSEDFASLKIPVLCVTGWFDGNQAGAMHYWQGLQQHSAATAQLIVGAWEHRDCYLGGTGRVGAL